MVAVAAANMRLHIVGANIYVEREAQGVIDYIHTPTPTCHRDESQLTLPSPTPETKAFGLRSFQYGGLFRL